MYNVINKAGVTLSTCETLSEAMAYAKTLGIFVTLKGPEYEICGKFGVDSVDGKLLPNGNNYEWMKRRKS
jgi:hypothetical protein